MKRCHGCAEPLTGQQRKWCSEWCRKQTLYGQGCVDCGKPTSGSDGLRDEPRCSPCANAKTRRDGTRRDMIRANEKRRRIHAMWHDDCTTRQIAEAIGTTIGTISQEIVRMRRAGWDLPLRDAGRR